MKLKESFVQYNLGDEQVMVVANNSKNKYHSLVRSNRTASFIVNCLQEETSIDDILVAMEAKFDASKEQIQTDIKRILNILRSIDALDE